MSAANPEGKRVLLLGAHVLTLGNEEFELFIQASKGCTYLIIHI
jgi:hypothetical protein